MKYSVVWFRNDLRIHDHEALFKATKSGNPVIGVYCFDPYYYQKTPYGFNKTGIHRARFILESINVLKENLNKLNIPLITEIGNTEEIFKRIDKLYPIENIYYHKEISYDELAIEEKLKENLKSVNFYGYYTHNIYHIDDYDIDKLSRVYTHFKNKLINFPIRKLFSTPNKNKERINVDSNIITLDKLGFTNQKTKGYFLKGGSIYGKEHLDNYLDNMYILNYANARNYLTGLNDSSKLSSYLAHGCLSPRYVYYKIKEFEEIYGPNKSIADLLNELYWRDYFWFVHYKYGNKLFSSKGLFDFPFPWKQDEDIISNWINGETGFTLVDASMKELKDTGFMSNRARQNVASFFSKNLKQDPMIGAAYFESQLVDYDISSNYGNWLYVSGIGNDSKYFRVFNVNRQVKQYDPSGCYIKSFIPTLNKLPNKYVHNPSVLTLEEQIKYNFKLGVDFPKPIIDLKSSRSEYLSLFKLTKLYN